MKFSAILSTMNNYPLTGIENNYPIKYEKENFKNCSIFIDNFKNVRLLLKNEKGVFISGLHIERQKTKREQHKILTVYTCFEERRKGHAEKLLSLARLHFKDIRHNEHLTKEGEKWVYSVEGIN